MGRRPMTEAAIDQAVIDKILSDQAEARLPFCLVDVRENKVAGKFASYTLAQVMRGTLVRTDTSNATRYVIAIAPGTGQGTAGQGNTPPPQGSSGD